ncbi:hypothetical protein A4S06_08585 [Erysipelotrichaceae bacterium MTC7]|nr:hypothetical protein A4S06_08585 [Erysipelotrichaceae bacterium MTC7]
MKFRLDENSKKIVHIGGAIAFIAIALFFFFSNFDVLKIWVHNVFQVLMPFIIGFVIAFLMNPIMILFETKVFAGLPGSKKLKRNISAILAVILGVVLVGLLVFVIGSQMRESLDHLLANYDKYLLSFESFMQDTLEFLHIEAAEVENILESSEDLLSDLLKNIQTYAPTIFNFGLGFITLIIKILVGIIAGVYMLMDKERFIAQFRQLNRALFPQVVSTFLENFFPVLRRIFYDFIVGKALDSLIIGIICYVGLELLGISYAPFISVIVGVTNMIPVFGPFIGAVPGIFILLLVEPIEALYFAIFVFALQQFDGNILGPKILGDKLGIPSFWVLFSVTVGGAIFGFVGMFIGVPVFAAIYYLVKMFVDYRLANKPKEEPTEI